MKRILLLLSLFSFGCSVSHSRSKSYAPAANTRNTVQESAAINAVQGMASEFPGNENTSDRMIIYRAWLSL